MSTNKNEDVIKYETKNPIVKLFQDNFFKGINRSMSTIDFESVFEAGCGSGYVTDFMKRQYPKADISAMDINEEKLSIAKARIKGVKFSIGSIYDIPHPENSFDLVISTQVIEHLDDPLNALKELLRISKRYVIISVPNEPLYRISNMVRLQHVQAFGNTPGHINHWSKSGICALANKVCDVRSVQTPFPFIILLCEKRKDT